mmetsp:Transcript_5194/g.4971  ORF Transcript_5194/g.4971 Transcript_5194/m.4971 type:complete len:361 (+) Transcript_5194:638-1720(+)
MTNYSKILEVIIPGAKELDDPEKNIELSGTARKIHPEQIGQNIEQSQEKDDDISKDNEYQHNASKDDQPGDNTSKDDHPEKNASKEDQPEEGAREDHNSEENHSEDHKSEDKNREGNHKEENLGNHQHSEENESGDENSKELEQDPSKAINEYEVNETQNNLKGKETESENKDSVENKPAQKKWPPYYKKALVICCLMSFFHQGTGINAITFFSTEIFKDGDEGNTAEKRARLGTLLLGVSALIGTAIAVFLFKIFSRKFFFHASGFVILGSHFLSGIFSLIDFDIGIIIMTMAYIMVFNGGMGPAMWIYSADVLDNFGTSVVALINMVFTCLFATFANLMFEHLTAPGMYFGLAFVQVL